MIGSHIAQMLLRFSSGAPSHPRFLLILKWQDEKFLRKTFWTLPRDSNPIFIRRINLLRKTVPRTYLGSHGDAQPFQDKGPKKEKKDNVEDQSSMWMLKHARLALCRRVDVTMTLHCDFVTNSVTSHLRRSDIDMSYLCHVTLWPVCESLCDKIVSHTVTSLWFTL